jgi:hypothetical protein
VGLDTFLGNIEIPFTQLLKECNLSLLNKDHLQQQSHLSSPPPSSKLGASLETVPSLNLKEGASFDSRDSFGDPRFESTAISPSSGIKSGLLVSPTLSTGSSGSSRSMSAKELPPVYLDSKGLNNLPMRRVSRSYSNSSTGSTTNMNLSSGASSTISSFFGSSQMDKRHANKRGSHSLTELPKLQPGHVQKWYELKPRKRSNLASDGMYKSWNGKMYPSKKVLAQQRRHPDYQGSGKQTLSVANVTGSIQIRYHVRRAERDTLELPPTIVSTSTRLPPLNAGSGGGGGGSSVSGGGGSSNISPMKKKNSFRSDLTGNLDV